MDTSETSTLNAFQNTSRSFENQLPANASQPDSNEQKYREAFSKASRCIGPHLRSFEEELSSQLVSNNPQIDRVLKYVARLGGKRLRPALTFLTAELFGASTEETTRLAMVVEMVHTATLVHDDVLEFMPTSTP